MLGLILLSVSLTSPFGTAEATATDAGPPLEVVMTVEVEDVREAVLVRMVSAAGELDPVAMVPRDDGTWGVTVRLTEREDVLVAFEAIPAEGESVISESHRLTELGVDPAVFTATTTTTQPGGDGTGAPVGWLVAAVVAATVAVALVAWWASPRRVAVDTPEEADLLSDSPDHSGEPDNTDGEP